MGHSLGVVFSLLHVDAGKEASLPRANWAARTASARMLPRNVRVKHGVSRDGHRLHYYLNYSSIPATPSYAYATGSDLLGGQALSQGQPTTLQPWDLLIVKENRPAQ